MLSYQSPSSSLLALMELPEEILQNIIRSVVLNFSSKNNQNSATKLVEFMTVCKNMHKIILDSPVFLKGLLDIIAPNNSAIKWQQKLLTTTSTSSFFTQSPTIESKTGLALIHTYKKLEEKDKNCCKNLGEIANKNIYVSYMIFAGLSLGLALGIKALFDKLSSNTNYPLIGIGALFVVAVISLCIFNRCRNKNFNEIKQLNKTETSIYNTFQPIADNNSSITNNDTILDIQPSSSSINNDVGNNLENSNITTVVREVDSDSDETYNPAGFGFN